MLWNKFFSLKILRVPTFRRKDLSLAKDNNTLSRTKLYPVPCHKNIQTSTRKYENLQLIKVFQAIN